MQNFNTFNTTGLSLELFHVQTNTAFDLPPNLLVIRVGKPNDPIFPDIDISSLPNADLVSRIHAQIQIDGSNYFIEDLGSSNGTFVNNTRLKPRTPYQVDLGDRIDLGQGGKVTFILQAKPQYQQNPLLSTIQSESAGNQRKISVDKTTKLVGLALMIAGVVILAASIQVGIFFRIPGILLCCAGVSVILLRRINPNLGWILIALGIAVVAFTGNILASVNLLVILVSSALFFGGYQVFTTGKILDYDLRSLQALIKK
ncbi:FHA domain-containing protein [aff. Roholtiella sp. LEGE 12411]|uniref:FHA domain-containing protein n=1 Tax=aff. Roholtiella sp. LEGE 12411 TaxID=1828822 RepID=UPI001882F69B|nr:FHA domain-containing protein [aff. Roholtiella sp. LEGE 12411]MBE9038205.1 FHA domain-containing protein [aff. Roholtiella sp. LEGE 12411]